MPSPPQSALRQNVFSLAAGKEPEEVITRVNRRVRGWLGYFHRDNSYRAFSKMQWQFGTLALAFAACAR